VNIFRFIPGYEHAIYNPGKEPILLLFLGFLFTFVFTRLYTRLARVRDWGSASAGDVHVHHMVPGVILMATCGILAFSPLSDNGIAWGLLALFFGIGAALTLDEFAMIFHVRDVYWSEEGRTSIDAMLMGLAAAALLLVGFAPFEVNNKTGDDPAALAYFSLGILTNATFATISFLKKKPFAGTVALLIPVVGVFSAVRLGKPDSPWARWFYDPERGSARRRKKRERKRRRSIARFEHGWPGRFERWFSDLVGGAPQLPPPVETEPEP
jgi:hypothetical protein